jgi:hypothetical protein
MLKAGKSPKEIRSSVRILGGTIRYHAKTLSIPRFSPGHPGGRNDPQRYSSMKRLRDSGASLRSIAKRFGISHQAVHYYLTYQVKNNLFSCHNWRGSVKPDRRNAHDSKKLFDLPDDRE